MSTDPAGTIRRSPSGVFAMRVGDAGQTPWLISHAIGGNYWRTSSNVASWPIVYTPPKIIGTIKRRQVTNGRGWEVQVLTEKGWAFLNQTGVIGDESVDAAYDDDDGAWETVYQPRATGNEGFSKTW